MFASEEAPESQPEAFPGQLRFGHPEAVGNGALNGREQHAAHLSDVEPGDEARSCLLAPCPDGLKLLLRPIEEPAHLREP
eukprot:1889676-Alexandrium_andersonii.AAC.1